MKDKNDREIQPGMDIIWYSSRYGLRTGRVMKVQTISRIAGNDIKVTSTLSVRPNKGDYRSYYNTILRKSSNILIFDERLL